jgi:hypothetical protein
MNHTNSTLVVVAIAVNMVVAGTAILALSSDPEHLAFAKGVKVGSTKNKCVVTADNSQHIAYGAGATGNTASNTATNTQSQTCNVGSTGAG